MRWVAGCAHISRFIAGATSSGQRSIGRARQSSESRSSARPCSSLAMKSALAGATSTASASRVRLMCAMLFGFARVPLARVDGAVRERLQRHGGDELLGRLGHHDLHGGAGLDQRARQLGGLVAGDAARQAEHDVAAREFGG